MAKACSLEECGKISDEMGCSSALSGSSNLAARVPQPGYSP